MQIKNCRTTTLKNHNQVAWVINFIVSKFFRYPGPCLSTLHPKVRLIVHVAVSNMAGTEEFEMHVWTHIILFVCKLLTSILTDIKSAEWPNASRRARICLSKEVENRRLKVANTEAGSLTGYPALIRRDGVCAVTAEGGLHTRWDEL